MREEREGAGGAAPFSGWDGGAHMLEKMGISNAISILFSPNFLSLIKMTQNDLL